MENGEVALEEVLEELEAMLKVCFEGETENANGQLSLKFPNGQRFMIRCAEE